MTTPAGRAMARLPRPMAAGTPPHPARKPAAWLKAAAPATALFLLACLLPPVAQPQAYHHFAAAVAAGPLDDVWNVLSNLAFLLAAGAGVLHLRQLPAGEVPARRLRLACALAASLALTGLGSAWYHARPDDLSLFWDRLPMTWTFAAVIALALEGDRPVPPAAGLLPLLAYGVASVAFWQATGNLTPYLVMQGGGLLLLAVLAVCRPRHGFPALAVVGWYGLAKALEHFDAAIAALTDGWVAGHPLKHMAAAMAGWVILRACCRPAAPPLHLRHGPEPAACPRHRGVTAPAP